MKILATSDWHLGNMFHGNDRLSEHRHFLQWLIVQIQEQQPTSSTTAIPQQTPNRPTTPSSPTPARSAPL